MLTTAQAGWLDGCLQNSIFNLKYELLGEILFRFMLELYSSFVVYIFDIYRKLYFKLIINKNPIEY